MTAGPMNRVSPPKNSACDADDQTDPQRMALGHPKGRAEQIYQRKAGDTGANDAFEPVRVDADQHLAAEPRADDDSDHHRPETFERDQEVTAPERLPGIGEENRAIHNGDRLTHGNEWRHQGNGHHGQADAKHPLDPSAGEQGAGTGENAVEGEFGHGPAFRFGLLSRAVKSKPPDLMPRRATVKRHHEAAWKGMTPSGTSC